VPVSHTTVPRRSVFPVPIPASTPPNPHRSPSSCTLAFFLNRQPRQRLRNHQSRRRSHSQEPRPAPAFLTNDSPPEDIPLFVSNPDIRQNHRAASSEPAFPSIYPNRRPARSNQAPVAPPPAPPPDDTHENPVDPRYLHHYYPEELYVSSVLPTRTPRELRHFQDHCWSIYQQRGIPCSITHGLDESRRITSSPLHFRNLLWRTVISFDKKGITELYYRITTYPRSNYPALPCLDPAYSVTYPWVGIFWTVNQFDKPQPPAPAL
jgi:hypothetical protein